MKLSIIVPVYNVEKYIVKCISSLLNQNNSNYEVIIVNDGTKDKSIELVKQHFIDTKISIINKKNGGLSSARNTGLQHAKGEYVWFFDSDDWISENVIDKIIEGLTNCEILYFNSYYYEEEKQSSICTLNNSNQKGCYFTSNNYHHGAPFYIYQKKYLQNNNFLFEEGIFHEDTLFTPQVLYRCNRIKAFNLPVYHRLIRENSITQTINPKRCYDLCYILEKLHNYNVNHVDSKYTYKWGRCIMDAVVELLNLSTKCSSKVQCDIKHFFNANTHFQKYLTHSPKKPTKIMGIFVVYFHFPLFQTYKLLSYIRYRN